MNTIIVFLIGLSVGTFVGIAIMALMVMAGRDEKNLSLINFPSIKEGDLIYIDEELERNGMKRE